MLPVSADNHQNTCIALHQNRHYFMLCTTKPAQDSDHHYIKRIHITPHLLWFWSLYNKQEYVFNETYSALDRSIIEISQTKEKKPHLFPHLYQRHYKECYN